MDRIQLATILQKIILDLKMSADYLTDDFLYEQIQEATRILQDVLDDKKFNVKKDLSE